MSRGGSRSRLSQASVAACVHEPEARQDLSHILFVYSCIPAGSRVIFSRAKLVVRRGSPLLPQPITLPASRLWTHQEYLQQVQFRSRLLALGKEKLWRTRSVLHQITAVVSHSTPIACVHLRKGEERRGMEWHSPTYYMPT